MSDLGDRLQEARRLKGVSLLQVADATRIKPEYLEALEQEDYAGLPGPAYITGFLRNYARFLGLHPDEVVEDYLAARPAPETNVKAATRVLANGHGHQNRTRLFWAMGAMILILAGAYAIKEYNDTYAHPASPPLNVTSASLGGSSAKSSSHTGLHASMVRVRLRSVSPVWVRVTVDGERAFQGVLRPRNRHALWRAHKIVYLLTYDGSRLRAFYDGSPLGLIADRPGIEVFAATARSWRRIS